MCLEDKHIRETTYSEVTVEPQWEPSLTISKLAVVTLAERCYKVVLQNIILQSGPERPGWRAPWHAGHWEPIVPAPLQRSSLIGKDSDAGKD